MRPSGETRPSIRGQKSTSCVLSIFLRNIDTHGRTPKKNFGNTRRERERDATGRFKVHRKIQQVIGPHNDLLIVVIKKRKKLSCLLVKVFYSGCSDEDFFFLFCMTKLFSFFCFACFFICICLCWSQTSFSVSFICLRTALPLYTRPTQLSITDTLLFIPVAPFSPSYCFAVQPLLTRCKNVPPLVPVALSSYCLLTP